MAKPKIDHQPSGSRLAGTTDSDSHKSALARKEISESLEVHTQLTSSCLNDILAVAGAIADALEEGHKVVFFGNGGSAADSQHLAAELVGKFATTRPPLKALALTTNTSVLTAVGNDFGFDEVFSRQVAAHIDKGDVVVAISTSGRSTNVINGVLEAKRLGAKSVALTGSSGYELGNLCDYRVMVPSTNTQRIQECHILIGHTLCALVEATLAT